MGRFAPDAYSMQRLVTVERSWSAAREQRTLSQPSPPLLHEGSTIWLPALLLTSHLICFLLGWALRGQVQVPCDQSHQLFSSDVTHTAETPSGSLALQSHHDVSPAKEEVTEEPLQGAAPKPRSLLTKRKGFDLSPIRSSSRRAFVKKSIHPFPSSSSSSYPAMVIQVDHAAMRSLALPLVALTACIHTFGETLESISRSLRSATEAKSSIQRQAMWCRCFRLGLWILVITLVLSSMKGGRVATVFSSCTVPGGAQASSNKPSLLKWPWSSIYFSSSAAFYSSSPPSSQTRASPFSSLGNLWCICHGLGLHAIALAAVWQLLLPLLRSSGSSGSIIMGFSSSTNHSQLDNGDLILDLGVGFGIIGSFAGAYLTSCLGGSWPVFVALWISWIAYLSASIAGEATGDGIGKERGGTQQGSWSRGIKILVLSAILPILIGSLPFHLAFYV